jgi:hypothetical protein
MRSFFYGGFPEPVLSNHDIFYKNWMENFFRLYIERDVARLFPGLNSIKYRRFIQILSQLSGNLINKSSISKSIDTSDVTVRDYLDIAHGSFIWRNILPYFQSASKSLTRMPKGVFRDSGLMNYIQRIQNLEQLKIHPNTGHYFEGFIIEELIRGISSLMITGWNYYYYRTKNLAEVDLILEGPFGVIPVEIKYGVQIKSDRLNSLKMFIESNHCPFGLLINNSDQVELLANRIIQIPAGLI